MTPSVEASKALSGSPSGASLTPILEQRALFSLKKFEHICLVPMTPESSRHLKPSSLGFPALIFAMSRIMFETLLYIPGLDLLPKVRLLSTNTFPPHDMTCRCRSSSLTWMCLYASLQSRKGLTYKCVIFSK